MQLASQHFTLVIGVDMHINTLPPFNPLHPFIGLVMDPMDYIPFIGGSVYINGRHKGVSDTSGMLITWQHIPLFSGPFALMPMIGHESVNFYGSINTYAEGSRLSPTTHMVMSCNDVGIPMSMQPGKKMKPIPSLFAPTSVSIPIPSGAPVMVGGPYVPDFAGALKNLVQGFGMGAFMKVGGKLLKGAGKLLKKALTALNKKVLKRFDCTKGLSKKFCKLGLEPVDLITGRVIYEGVDFTLPGPIPLSWERVWYSDSGMKGALGHGTHLAYDLKLQIWEDCIGVTLPDGRAAAFECLLPEESGFNRPEQLTLTNHGTHYALFDHASRLSYVFEPARAQHYYTYTDMYVARPSQEHYQLSRIENELGHRILFSYQYNRRTGKDHLAAITDSAGRELAVLTDSEGRITGVDLLRKVGKTEQRETLIQYGYNPDGDLTAITDALGKTTRMVYEQHRMVEKTDRNGQTFYWAYDARGRCVHTWGDGGILEGWLAYHTDHTAVTDNLQRTTRYYFNADKQCTQMTHPEGGHTLYEYNSWGELYRQIDPDGNLTGYHYDHEGRKTGVTMADGGTVRYTYDQAGRLMMVTNPAGAHQVWVYDQAGKLKSTQAPDGGVTFYTYNESNLISQIRDPQGKIIGLAYDERYNLQQVTLPDGSASTWYYDYRGRCLHTSRSGQLQTFTYDALGRVTHVQLPDGNGVQLSYNAYDEVVEARDHRHHVKFAYTPMGSLKMREQNGTKVHFHYNTQEELLALSNEKGERYLFERNGDGHIIGETGFDGLHRRYQRSKAGQVLRVERPGKRWTEYEYDGGGRVNRAQYSDGSWEIYSYNKNGQLIAARNEQSELHLERDVLGRVVKEVQDGYQVESRYDKIGNRVGVSSSLGALLELAYNPLGQVSGLSAQQGESEAWQAKLHYNNLGLEVERVMNGNLRSQWDYDSAGRPLEHKVGIGKRLQRHKRYSWGVNDTLRNIQCVLSGQVQAFEYDLFGNLVTHLSNSFDSEHYFRDAVGNIFAQEDKKDRTYGKGGQLQQMKGTSYEYDQEGFLVRKIEKDGKTWHYHWQGNGMLKQVVRPDRKTVEFEYDALGRRIAKLFEDTITRWVWDGNTPLHEWKYEIKDRPQAVINEFGQITKDKAEPVEKLITWVFDQGTFRPAAKIEGNTRYSIINDYLGTPKEAYDTWGNKIWEIELEAYGKVRTCSGDKGFIPFRFQGQYHDVETGLYYNRFRYYSPEEAMYVNQDPKKMCSGISFSYMGWNNKPSSITISEITSSNSFYAYVTNVNSHIDPLGLVRIHTEGNIEVNAYPGPAVGGKEHAPLHVHVVEGKNETRVLMEDYYKKGKLAGSKGDVYPGDPAMSKKMRKVVEENLDQLAVDAKSVFETGSC